MMMRNALWLTVVLLMPTWTVAASPGRAQLLEDVRPRAVEQVFASSTSDDPFLRANALEAVVSLPDRALPMVQLALDDEHPAVRFAALVTMGRLQQEEAGETVLAMMLDDESASVRAAARFAAHMTGAEVSLGPLANMLASPSPSLRSNVAILLGEMGDRSAVPMLAELARTPMPRVDEVRQALTRLQVAETMARLGDEASMDALRAGAYSNLDEVRVLSVQALGKLEDRQMSSALRHMLELEGQRRPPIEVRLAAAEALARMGDTHERLLSTMLEGASMDEPPIQAQAAMAMAYLADRKAVEKLAGLLDHSHEQVRLAAAAAILRAGEVRVVRER
ncbi:HEAT repeat domain-containing protein [Phycisphaerales bacterium AB-hyl4]|uniref:HEAT repeat domain-containing protein n=1 Tax=Natronomicrosphaera hydrolytica TaxID=3242702 RepID=A0ABV4U4B8_9BACT